MMPQSGADGFFLPEDSTSGRGWIWIKAESLLVLAVMVYIPVIFWGGFIWDDHVYILQNPHIRTVEGLKHIWLDPRATPQYYPLVHTTYWIEFHLWNLHPLGYHLVNVVLHGMNAAMIWLALRWLAAPGAWLAAAIFAVHPVHAESVAWITERKNVLSGFFYLAALLSYLSFLGFHRPDDGHGGPSAGRDKDVQRPADRHASDWRFYGLALLLFAGALLSKTVTCSLPVMIGLILWWKTGRLDFKEVARLLPLFFLGAALGLHTVWLERHHVGAMGPEWNFSWIDRCLIAGRALWFYAGKLCWPSSLSFIYPRWPIDASSPWQYVFPAAAIAVVAGIWMARSRIGRGPLVAVLFFAISLVPALGFFDVYPMRFSFVADHFQYLASIGLIVLAAAACRNLKGPLFLVILPLGLVTGFQSGVYENLETLWRDTIAKNPGAWIAHNNLGVRLVELGRPLEAIDHYDTAIALKTDYATAHYNRGMALRQAGRQIEVHAEFRRALEIDPFHIGSLLEVGIDLSERQQVDSAVRCFEKILDRDPAHADARAYLERIRDVGANIHYNLGITAVRQERFDDAAGHFNAALKLRPAHLNARHNLAVILSMKGRVNEAIEQFSIILQYDPQHAARQNLEAARALKQAAQPK